MNAVKHVKLWRKKFDCITPETWHTPACTTLTAHSRFVIWVTLRWNFLPFIQTIFFQILGLTYQVYLPCYIWITITIPYPHHYLHQHLVSGTYKTHISSCWCVYMRSSLSKCTGGKTDLKSVTSYRLAQVNMIAADALAPNKCRVINNHLTGLHCWLNYPSHNIQPMNRVMGQHDSCR